MLTLLTSTTKQELSEEQWRDKEEKKMRSRGTEGKQLKHWHSDLMTSCTEMLRTSPAPEVQLASEDCDLSDDGHLRKVDVLTAGCLVGDVDEDRIVITERSVQKKGCFAFSLRREQAKKREEKNYW